VFGTEPGTVIWQAIRGGELRVTDCYLLLSAPVETRLQLHSPKPQKTGKHWLHFNPSVFKRLMICQFLISIGLGRMSAKPVRKALLLQRCKSLLQINTA